MVASLVPTGRAAGVALGGVALGLCVLMYFYFWTGAVLALGLYLAWLILLAWRRPEARSEHLRQAGAVAGVLAVGLLLGLPQVLENVRAFAHPEVRAALARMFKPTPLAHRRDPVAAPLTSETSGSGASSPWGPGGFLRSG